MSESTVSFTTDMWTSCARMGYITVTAHYISSDWKLHNKVIATRAVPEKHTGVNIANVLINIKDEFQIQSLKALTTDNAQNMVVAANEAGFERWPCFSHTLQLAINDALAKIPAITKAVAFGRKLVSHFNHSPLSVKALKEQQKTMGVQTPLTVVQDVSTRWNSQFLMIDRLLKIRVAIYGVLLDENVTKPSERANLAVPEASWKVMEDVAPILARLVEARELPTSEKVPTISQIYVLLFHLLKTLSPADEDHEDSVGDPAVTKDLKKDSAVAKDLKKKLSQNIRDRFKIDTDLCPNESVLCSLAMVSTLLDPRYKSLWFLPEGNKKVLMDFAIDLMSHVQPTESSGPSATTVVKSETPKKQSKMLEWMMGDIVDLTSSPSNSGTTAELNRFVDEPVREKDPLLWWKQNDNK